MRGQVSNGHNSDPEQHTRNWHTQKVLCEANKSKLSKRNSPCSVWPRNALPYMSMLIVALLTICHLCLVYNSMCCIIFAQHYELEQNPVARFPHTSVNVSDF